MIEHNGREYVDVPIGTVKMTPADRDQIFAAYDQRHAAAAARNEYYGWPDFVREIFAEGTTP